VRRLAQLIALLACLGAGGVMASSGPTPRLLVTEASTTAEELLARGDAAGFEPFADARPNLGFLPADKAAWVRIDLEGKPDRHMTRAIELGITRLREVDWHLVADGKVIGTRSSGAVGTPAAEMPGQRKPWVEVHVPPGGSRTVLLRVASDTAIWLPVRIGSHRDRDEWNLDRTMTDFTVFGACLGIALLNLTMGWIARSPVYAVAGILPLAHVAYQAVFLGYLQAAAPTLPRWVSKQGMLLIAIVLGIGLFLFSHRLLDTASRRVRRLTQAAIALGALAVPVVLAAPYPVGSQLANLLLVTGGLLCALAATSGVRAGPRAEAILLATGWSLPLGSGILLLLQLGGHMPAWFNPTTLVRIILPGTFILFALAAVRHQRRLREAETGLESSRRRQEQARMDALRHQLNPHLAFNTLASIEALSREAPERIPALVARLAAFLRHRMSTGGSAFHTLREELEATQAYLDIERTHLEERLEVRTRIGEDVLGLAIPEFTLQPLVENAIKHGLTESERVTVRLEAEREGDRLRLRVANTGRIRPPRAIPRGEGIGLENLRQRLALHLGDRARVGLREEDGWVLAEVELPASPEPPSP
jgi:two-component sensor histidine kinase